MAGHRFFVKLLAYVDLPVMLAEILEERAFDAAREVAEAVRLVLGLVVLYVPYALLERGGGHVFLDVEGIGLVLRRTHEALGYEGEIPADAFCRRVALRLAFFQRVAQLLRRQIPISFLHIILSTPSPVILNRLVP